MDLYEPKSLTNEIEKKKKIIDGLGILEFTVTLLFWKFFNDNRGWYDSIPRGNDGYYKKLEVYYTACFDSIDDAIECAKK